MRLLLWVPYDDLLNLSFWIFLYLLRTPKRTTKIQKEAKELAKRKAEMMTPENSVLVVMRSASPPRLLSLSVQVEDLDEFQSDVDNGNQKVPSSNLMAYAKAAEAAKEAAERLRRPTYSTNVSLKSKR